MAGQRSAEVAIIGGGVIGCSIAWHLTSAGLSDVVLFEKRSLASGATGICPGGIRQQFEGDADCRWALASMPFWEQINDILTPPHPFTFERSGYLFVAHTRELLQRYEKNVARQNELGIPSEILSPDEISRLLPAVETGSVVGGAFCAGDGFIEDCHGVTHTMAARAADMGARILFEEADSVRRVAGAWHVETRAAGAVDRFSCRLLILAAGVDSVPLARGIGLQLPIESQRRRLAFTVPYGELVMPPLVVAPELRFAGKQLANGAFYIGWLEETGEEPELVFTENALRAGVPLLPLLADLPVRRLLAGVYDTTPDHRPLIGGVAGFEGLGLAVGFSGHGFMLAPAVGEALTSWATGKATELPLQPFAAARFGSRTSSPSREGLVI